MDVHTADPNTASIGAFVLCLRLTVLFAVLEAIQAVYILELKDTLSDFRCPKATGENRCPAGKQSHTISSLYYSGSRTKSPCLSTTQLFAGSQYTTRSTSPSKPSTIDEAIQPSSILLVHIDGSAFLEVTWASTQLPFYSCCGLWQPRFTSVLVPGSRNVATGAQCGEKRKRGRPAQRGRRAGRAVRNVKGA